MLKKDLIELCLLQMLCMGDKYGYEMLSPLRAAFPDTQESAIYAILRGLCKNGFTQWYMAEGGGGPARKYYKITLEGKERLAALQSEWQRLLKAMAEFEHEMRSTLRAASPDTRESGGGF